MPDENTTPATATNATNVSAAKPAVAGSIMVGATSATLPTTTTATLTGFSSVGYISEDGVTNSNSPSIEVKKAWGGDPVLASMTERPDTFKFKMIEALNPNAMKVVFKDSDVTGTLSDTNGISIKASAAELGEKAYVIDMLLKSGVAKRIVIPRATVTSVGETTYKDNEIIAYEVELTCMPDAAGYTHYEYIK